MSELFFILSKVLGAFVIPSNFLMLTGAAGLALTMTRFTRAARWFVFGSLITLAIVGFSPVGNALLIPLENRFPPWDESNRAPDGIIVLGGAIDGESRRHELSLNDALERLTVVPELAKRYPRARILYSGGSGTLSPVGIAEASLAKRQLEALGVAMGRIELEDHSRNTAENAIFSKAAVQPNLANAGPW